MLAGGFASVILAIQMSPLYIHTLFMALIDCPR